MRIGEKVKYKLTKEEGVLIEIKAYTVKVSLPLGNGISKKNNIRTWVKRLVKKAE